MKSSINKYVAGNWKMNLTISEGVTLTNEIISITKDQDVKVVLAPPFTHLASIKTLIKNEENVFLAAQTCSQFLKGAHTGEVSPVMLQDIGVDYIIIGHSERRGDNFETNELLKAKVDTVLAQGMKVIFCCGESLAIRESGDEVSFVLNQLEESIGHLDIQDLNNIVLAYEPIWAIGTGVTASSAQAQDMHENIRRWMEGKFGTAGQSVSILYGGSCKPTNAVELFSKPDINGGLIGGAALKAQDFTGIINSF